MDEDGTGTRKGSRSNSNLGTGLEAALEKSLSISLSKSADEMDTELLMATGGVSSNSNSSSNNNKKGPLGAAGGAGKVETSATAAAELQRAMELAKANNAHYIDTHPEVRGALQDFMSALLLEKPEDVYAFARQHFQSQGKVPRDKLLRPLVICGPSGVGKGTLMNMLFEEFGGFFGFSVSHTTRAPRPGEVHGVHYNFTSREVMSAAIDEGRFLEFAQVHTNLYGTSIDAVKKVQRAGKVCVLDIDVQGVMKIKETDVNPHLIFIAPPSVEQLEGRLRGRATESEKDIETRLSAAREEIDYGLKEGNFEHVVVNDKLEKAYADLKATLVGYYPHLAAPHA